MKAFMFFTSKDSSIFVYVVIRSAFALNTHLKYIVAFGAQNHNALVEMVMFHGACRIEDGQWACCFCLK